MYHFIFQKVLLRERGRRKLSFAKAVDRGVLSAVVLAVISWDEDVGSSYNTHGRRRIFVKESVVAHDSAFKLLFVYLFLYSVNCKFPLYSVLLYID